MSDSQNSICFLFDPKKHNDQEMIQMAIAALEATVKKNKHCRMCPENNCPGCPTKAAIELRFYQKRSKELK